MTVTVPWAGFVFLEASRTSPSTSESLASRPGAETSRRAFFIVAPESATATGMSLTGETAIETVASAQSPLGSQTR